jgi:hypothetical protein
MCVSVVLGTRVRRQVTNAVNDTLAACSPVTERTETRHDVALDFFDSVTMPPMLLGYMKGGTSSVKPPPRASVPEGQLAVAEALDPAGATP